MCEVCGEERQRGNPAQAANQLLERLAVLLSTMDEGGAGEIFPATWEDVNGIVSDLDLLCMEHLTGKVTTPTFRDYDTGRRV